MSCLMITVTCIYVDSIGYPVVTLGYGIKTAASESIRRVRIITPWPALTETDRSTHSWQNLVCFARNKLIGWSNPLLYIPSRCSSGDKASWGGFPAMLSHQ